jgi:rhodanese-related sulfurtransferase
MGAQEPDGVVGEHAVGAAAVGDDLPIVGQLHEAVGQFVEGDADGVGDAPSRPRRLPRARREMDATNVLDVRQASEVTAGYLPGAHLIELGSLAEHASDLPTGPARVMCGHGERAATAASLLERAGHHEVSILAGGAHDWAKVTGRTLDTRR